MNDVSDLLKKGFYLGLGAGAMLKETIEKTGTGLNKTSEEISQEGEKLGKDIMGELQKQVGELQVKGQALFEKQVGEAGVATQAHVRDLEARLAVVEARLRDLEGRIAGGKC